MSSSETRRILLEAVDGIRDKLEAEWRAEEDAGTLSPASVDALAEAGILAMKLPRELGGHEADPSTQVLVLEALAEANPSASWCAMVGATSIGLPGAFLADHAVAEIFKGDRLPHGAVVAMPAGKVERVDGGWRLSGRWPFVSGVPHADWIAAGAIMAFDDGAEPVHGLLAFPAAEATIHDNWQVAGLMGTGSNDVSVEDLFVPDGFAWPMHGAEPQRGGALYRIGHPGFIVNEHAGFALGTARRALDGFVSGVANKQRGLTAAPSRLAQRPTVQRMLGEAEMRLGAAKALTLQLNDRLWALAEAGETIPERLHAELRAVAVHCTEVALDVVTGAFRLAGGSAAYRGHVLQQCLRDINVAAQHLMVSEIAYENLGQFVLGLPDASAMR